VDKVQILFCRWYISEHAQNTAGGERSEHATGLLTGGPPAVFDILDSDNEILKTVKLKTENQSAHIAIDAPLIVPNQEGRRLAEAEVGRLFRKYHAGAHPANRNRLSSWGGKIRGEEITKLLVKQGFRHDPYIRQYEKSRKLYEVYPHPSMVVLFGLDKILKYKAKPNRSYEYRWKQFRTYYKHLSNLIAMPERMRFSRLRGNALKKYEDKLDAVFCAYIAYYCWKHPERCAVLGNMKQGYIMTPVFEDMKRNI
jgi:predicted RNase H-like nuclease